MKNVFHLSWRPRYYLTHPIEFIRTIFRNIGDMWRRATRGWTYKDVWNFNYWFLEVIPDMLDYLADHGYGYPGDDEFDTPEKWNEWLHAQAAAIRSCQEEEQEKRNEHREEYEAALDQTHISSHPDPKHPEYMILDFDESENMDEIRERYWARAGEISNEAKEELIKAMTELARRMPSLWD